MDKYFLPRHVHFCLRGDSIVFLDLNRDEYTLVSGDAAACLLALSSGGTPSIPSTFPDALAPLIREGLLTTERQHSRSISPTSVRIAAEPLIDADVPVKARTTLGVILNFAFACASAAVRLHWVGLKRTVAHVEQRKRRQGSGRTFDVDKARKLTVIFRTLRCVIPTNYLCLYDSLALIEFLARYRLYPTWVFGVRLEPWAAHCWVQEQGFALNEGFEEADGYTPVMAV